MGGCKPAQDVFTSRYVLFMCSYLSLVESMPLVKAKTASWTREALRHLQRYVATQVQNRGVRVIGLGH